MAADLRQSESLLTQGRSSGVTYAGFHKGGQSLPLLPPLPSLSLPSPPVPSFPSPPVPSMSLEVGPFKSSYGVWGSAISSLSGVWGRAPAEIEFGAF